MKSMPRSTPQTIVLSPEALAQRLRPLFARPDVRCVVLFGSALHRETTDVGDYDLGVQCDGPVDLLVMTNLAARLLGTDAVDLVDLRRASPLLAMEIARKGRLLYERKPGVFAEFVSLAFRRYLDTAKLRKAHEEALRQFLQRRGLR